MAERPEAQNPLATRLAERYGMTNDAVEDLMNQTQTEYSGKAAPPVETSSQTPIEEAAARLPSSADPTIMIKSANKPLSGGFLAAIFTVLLIALAVALSFQRGCFQQRNESRGQRR